MQILHASLGEVISGYSQSFTSLIDNARRNVLPFGDRDSATPLHSLAFDAGRNIGGIDLALSQSIRPFLNAPGYDERLVSLLPMVGTLMYFSEHWKKSQFLYQI
jgi:hypothetical protein